MDRAKRSRAGHRAIATRLIAQLEEKIKEKDMEQVEELLQRLTLKEEDLKKMDQLVEDKTDDDDLEAEILEAEQYREKTTVWKVRANRFLEKCKEERISTNAGIIPPASSQTSKPYAIKLPKLEIRKFNGDITKWQMFWEQFVTAVHKNTSLSTINKFNYLKTLVEGSAATAIEGLQMTEMNYPNAIQILTERFGKKELIVNAHMNRLLDLRELKQLQPDAASMRRLYDVCETQIRGLQALGVTLEGYGSLLYAIVIKVLPAEIALEWQRKRASVVDDAQELLNFLKKEIEGREKIAFSQTEKEESNEWQERQKKPQMAKKSWTPSATALQATTDEAVPSKVKQGCLFCDNLSHRAAQCDIVKEVADRIEKLKKMGRCFRCLSYGHMSRSCSRRMVKCSKCGGRHNAILCNNSTLTDKNELAKASVGSGENVVVSYMTRSEGIASTDGKAAVYLQTVQAWAEGESGRLRLRCLLDGGSQRSFITQKMAKKLKLKTIGEEKLNVQVFGGAASTKCFPILQLSLVALNGARIKIQVLEVPEICRNVVSWPSKSLQSSLEAYKICLSDNGQSSREIDVLIGADSYWKMVTGQMRRLGQALMLTRSVFGWMVQGREEAQQASCSSMDDISSFHVAVEETSLNDELKEQVKRLWELEAIGIQENKEGEGMNKEDTNVLKSFEETIKYVEGRYEVRMPFKDYSNMGDNYKIAENRLKLLLKRLGRDEKLWTRYQQGMKDYLNMGHAEEVDPNAQTNEKLYYLPHHPVIKEERTTTKCRIVYDASSHQEGKASLNDCLFSGPNLNPELPMMLMQFRSHAVALAGDIEKAFLQVRLAEEDRDCVRVLWVSDDWKPGDPAKLKMLRMTRVTFGVKSSTFHLAATIRHHAKKKKELMPQACTALGENTYVDDCLTGANDNSKACQLYEDLKSILAEAGMSLRKWISNSKELMECWQRQGESLGVEKNIGTREPIASKVLGMSWLHERDVLIFDVKSLLQFIEGKRPTKKLILQTVARMFDPLGILTPITVTPKCLFQRLWKKGIEWDEDLPLEFKTAWERWCKDLPLILQLEVPRWYAAGRTWDKDSSCSLHVFCDASQDAYGAVVYLRIGQCNGQSGVSLVASRCRVAPLKNFSIPRLELMGALLAARLGNYVKRALKSLALNCIFWTDSLVVLGWIKSDSKQWKTFVANRVSEIQTLTDPAAWHHCPGIHNPADILSRGKNAAKLLEDTVWLHGPDWLTKNEDEWPMPSEEMVEKNAHIVKEECRNVKIMLQTTDDNCGDGIFDLTRFSSLKMVIKITGWVLRFVQNCKIGRQSKGELTTEERKKALQYWIATEQRKTFAEETSFLKAKLNDLPGNSKIKQLRPFMDEDGLMRVGGRLHEADWNRDQRHPVILGQGRFAELIIQDSHERVMHGGTRDTLVDVREHYWILRARQTIKRIIYRCPVCRRFSAKPGREVEAPLPKDRLTEAPPFSVTGLDFAGPIYIKMPDGKCSKAYIVLFTCAVVRAVHLEVVSSQTTVAFLMSLRRFLARRGLCSTIYSDNAKTFQKADREIQKLWRSVNGRQLQAFLGERCITWKFIVERAAWWGGYWERIVRSVKTCLKKILGKACLCIEELMTVLAEVEAVVNSRPLTYVYSTPDEGDVLTPAHFLIGRRAVALPDESSGYKDIGRTGIAKKWRQRRQLVNSFWNRWKTEYLGTLRSLHSVKQPKGEVSFIVGDVALVHDTKLPRQMWKTGLIEALIQGRDNKIRTVVLKMPNGQIIRRPVQLVYPLELSEE